MSARAFAVGALILFAWLALAVIAGADAPSREQWIASGGVSK